VDPPSGTADRPVHRQPASAKMMRIRPLGDSITQADCNHDSYRRALWHALENADDNFTFVGTWNTNFGNCLPPGPDFDTWNQGQWGVPASSVFGGLKASRHRRRWSARAPYATW
jgi:hypothetical protein